MSTKDRSVCNYQSRGAIKAALASPARDWELTNYDEATTDKQELTLESEFERLLVLKSYGVLDTDDEVEFSETTREARKLFGVEIAVVSLVDMGRQWFKSIDGLDAKETPRSCAFCAHVIKRNEDDGILVVRDATKDKRFMDNPLVTGGPKIRFYAGAPLVSPEGPRLGTFCIIDSKPRPEGLSEREESQLRQLASETVYNIIMR